MKIENYGFLYQVLCASNHTRWMGCAIAQGTMLYIWKGRLYFQFYMWGKTHLLNLFRPMKFGDFLSHWAAKKVFRRHRIYKYIILNEGMRWKRRGGKITGASFRCHPSTRWLTNFFRDAEHMAYTTLTSFVVALSKTELDWFFSSTRGFCPCACMIWSSASQYSLVF